MNRILRFLVCVPLLLAAACTAVGDRTLLSVGYYSIEGGSFHEIDQQIALHGPSVAGVGRALAATSIQMLPEFKFGFADGMCRIEDVHIAVKAHVTLPKLNGRDRLKRHLSRAWDNLEQYARLHEAVHVSIADGYALRAEREIGALPPEPGCAELRANAIFAFRRLMAEHESEQLRFDEEEKGRIAALVANGKDRTPE